MLKLSHNDVLILQNLVQNAGSIGLNFLGSFFGLDLSQITGTANSILGGIDLPKEGEGDGELSLPGDEGVASILGGLGGLPPGYEDALASASGAKYDPKGGAEQWRPVVKKVLAERAAVYGIKNVKAWEDALIRQINTESGGNPGAANLNDTDGKGGTQQVFGIGQFLPTTFAAHNVTGGDINDPVAQIYAMVDYVASKYGMDSTGGPNQIGRGVGYASGGKIKGKGNGRSDSIIARVSNGEFLVKAPMAQKHLGLLQAINSNQLPGFADGMMWPTPAPAPVTPPPAPVAPPPAPPVPVPAAPDPVGPQASAEAGVPAPPTDPASPSPAEGEQTALSDIGAALGGIGGALGEGAEAPEGGTPEGDPRSALGAAPQNLDHNKPAVSQGIQAAAGAIAGAVSTAMQAASVAANASAPGSGQGVSSAAGIVNGMIAAGGTAVSGAVNILSSLGVGSVTPSSSTAGAYGSPLLPSAQGQDPYKGPAVVNNWNGGVHTSNNDEFYRIQQRRELQAAAPSLPPGA